MAIDVIQGDGPALRGVRVVSKAMLVVGGLVMLAATGLIVLEVALRQIFNTSLGATDEFAGYALAISSSWSFAAALIDKAHVRIDSLYLCFPRRIRVWLDIVSLSCLLGLMLVLLRYVWIMLESSARFGSTSQSTMATPLVVPQALWVVGLGWFVVATTVLLASALRALSKGDLDRVSALAGPVTPKEEVDNEIKDVARRQ